MEYFQDEQLWTLCLDKGLDETSLAHNIRLMKEYTSMCVNLLRTWLVAYLSAAFLILKKYKGDWALPPTPFSFLPACKVRWCHSCSLVCRKNVVKASESRHAIAQCECEILLSEYHSHHTLELWLLSCLSLQDLLPWPWTWSPHLSHTFQIRWQLQYQPFMALECHLPAILEI